MSAAAGTIFRAVDNALTNDATLMAMLVLAPRGVYAEGDVPPGHPVSVPGTNRVGYISIGGSTERDADHFVTRAADGELTIYIRSTNKNSGMRIYKEVDRILYGTVLPPAVMNPDSQALVEGIVRLIDDYPSEPTDGSHNTVLQYVTATVSTA